VAPSGIRITAGKFKGRRIVSAADPRTRYTSAKVREAVFDLVGSIEGWAVLDLFAGAGSFTIEALSRQAAMVASVEKDRQTAAILRKNLRSLSLDKDCLVMNMEVRYAVPMLARQGKRFDLIFVDPPYDMGYIGATAALLRTHRLHHDNSVFVFEHSKREEPFGLPETGCKPKARRYGDTVLSVITCEAG
jgi:16S rRNA (guanine966-N2)-methyltransferase